MSQPENAFSPISLTFDLRSKLVKLVHPLKVQSPIVSRVEGNVTVSRLVQLRNTALYCPLDSILVTPSGISTFFKAVHSAKQPAGMTGTPAVHFT